MNDCYKKNCVRISNDTMLLGLHLVGNGCDSIRCDTYRGTRFQRLTLVDTVSVQSIHSIQRFATSLLSVANNEVVFRLCVLYVTTGVSIC